MEKLYIQDDCKRKRLAEYFNCLYCDKEFLRAKKGKNSRKFCSPECGNKSRRKQIELTCFTCSRRYTRVPSKAYGRSKNNVSFCSNACKYSVQNLDCPNAPALPKHYGTSDGRSSNYRRRRSSLEKLSKGCFCGEKRIFLLTIHHIDGNRSNNSQDNLECVCANCHMIRHLHLKDGVWVYKSNSLTPRHLIQYLTENKQPE
jgi:hypothetical protein